MILFLWIKSYKNLSEIGINLTSRYEFSFDYNIDKNDISGCLSCKTLVDSPQIFDNYLWDLKALIGKNGTGKSSILFSLIDDVLTDYPASFDGIVVTDKYIFNRKGIKIKGAVEIDGIPLREIKNAEISNFERNDFERHLTEAEAKQQKGYKIIDTFLADHALFYYSPLLNYDRIYEGETAIAGNGAYEVDGDKFFDLSTESQIHNDSNSFQRSVPLKLNSVSETLCHKSRESERMLKYLLAKKEYPFEIKIPTLIINLNQYDVNFWEDISRIFQNDNNTRNLIEEAIHNVTSHTMNTGWLGFKEELYQRFIFSLLSYEVSERYLFGTYGEYNALTYTLNKFLTISKKARTLRGLLKLYIQNLQLPSGKFSKLFDQIESFVKFLATESKKNNIVVSTYAIEFPFANKKFLTRFIKFTESFQGLRNREILPIHFPVFSYDFSGLSAGEKSFLHLFSRFYSSFKHIGSKTSDIVILLDEPEITFHPQWQKRMISILCNFIKSELTGRRVQLVITGHSPIIISDLPKSNIVFLDIDAKGKPVISTLKNTENTFAANIHALYADAFFIQNGTIGEFAKNLILIVIRIIKEKDVRQKDYAGTIIRMVGDPLIRQRLEEMFSEAFDHKSESVDQEILRLEIALQNAKRKRNENR